MPMSNMTINDFTVQKAVDHLKNVDPALGKVIERVGPCTLLPEADGSHFHALTRAIVFQQLSGRAAATIYGRFLTLYGDNPPEPAQVYETTEEQLRSAGLSRGKAAYLRDLSARCLSGELAIDNLHTAADDEIIEQVTRVKGIGRWTAQMFLLFRLGRTDILSELDLGIRKGIRNLHQMERLPTYDEVEVAGLKWSPFRSIASWYLWRSLE